jgi:nucleoid-associated protein YgaU
MSPEKVAVLLVTVLITALLATALLNAEKAEAATRTTSFSSVDSAAESDPVDEMTYDEIRNGRFRPSPPPARRPEAGGVAAPPSRGYADYVVRKGDTLSGIARKLLGSSARYPSIVDANPGLDPNKLTAGVTIKIPQSTAPKSDAADGRAAPPRQKRATRATGDRARSL